MRLQFSGQEHKHRQSERRAFAEATEIISLLCRNPHQRRAKVQSSRTRRCTEGARALHQEGREVAVGAALYSPWQGMKWVAEENREGSMLLKMGWWDAVGTQLRKECHEVQG